MHNKIICSFWICIFFSLSIYSQEKKRDTVFINYDKTVLIEKKHPHKNYIYYLFKNSGNNGVFFLKEVNKLAYDFFTIDYGKRICLKKLVLEKKFYSGKNNTSIIDDWELSEYFFDKIIFMVKTDSIIKLEPKYGIE